MHKNDFIMFLSPIIAEAQILVTPLLPPRTKHFYCYLDSNTTLLEMKSHLNYNTINHDNLIRTDISPQLNGANIKQKKEQDNNNNISTLRNVTVKKDKKHSAPNIDLNAAPLILQQEG
jgi:hypothetical protein